MDTGPIGHIKVEHKTNWTQNRLVTIALDKWPLHIISIGHKSTHTSVPHKRKVIRRSRKKSVQEIKPHNCRRVNSPTVGTFSTVFATVLVNRVGRPFSVRGSISVSASPQENHRIPKRSLLLSAVDRCYHLCPLPRSPRTKKRTERFGYAQVPDREERARRVPRADAVRDILIRYAHFSRCFPHVGPAKQSSPRSSGNGSRTSRIPERVCTENER